MKLKWRRQQLIINYLPLDHILDEQKQKSNQIQFTQLPVSRMCSCFAVYPSFLSFLCIVNAKIYEQSQPVIDLFQTMVRLSMVVVANEKNNTQFFTMHFVKDSVISSHHLSWARSMQINNQVSLSPYIDATETKLAFIKYYKIEWKC